MDSDYILSLKRQILNLEKELLGLLNIQTMTQAEERIYTQAKLHLGQHVTLDETVPAEVGCAEAVSYILKAAGISDGATGIAGTASLYQWLLNSPLFQKIDNLEQGALIISPTGQGNGTIEGHTGVVAAFNTEFPNDFGILSNDSASGKFLETWSGNRWKQYYGQTGSLPVYLFRAN